MEAQDGMLRRGRKSFTSAMIPAAILCCGVTPAAGFCADPGSGKQSVLLGSSRAISGEFEAANARRVARAFADVRVGSKRATVSAEELQMMLGPAERPRAGSADAARSKNAELATVEIESGDSSVIHESELARQVPFGFGGIAWALRYPTQAWRLVMPVLGDDATS